MARPNRVSTKVDATFYKWAQENKRETNESMRSFTAWLAQNKEIIRRLKYDKNYEQKVVELWRK